MYKKTKIIFGFFLAQQGLIIAPTYLHLQWRSGLRSSL